MLAERFLPRLFDQIAAAAAAAADGSAPIWLRWKTAIDREAQTTRAAAKPAQAAAGKR